MTDWCDTKNLDDKDFEIGIKSVTKIENDNNMI